MQLRKMLQGGVAAASLTLPLGTSLSSPASGAQTAPHDYAASVLATVPVPTDANPVSTLRAPLVYATGAPTMVSGVVTVGRTFEVPASVDLAAFFNTHLPSNRDPGGCSAYSNNSGTQHSCQHTLDCANRHAALCGAAYNFETLGQQQELLVSVYVVWRPIVSASFPSSGMVTVTGYARSSAMSGSSVPVSGSPTSAQRQSLAAALAGLRGAPGGFCMQDSTLFTITVRSGVAGPVVWRAKADICPGTIVVSWSGHKVALNGRNCALANAVRAVLPPAARATREYLSSCL